MKKQIGNNSHLIAVLTKETANWKGNLATGASLIKGRRGKIVYKVYYLAYNV